MAVIPTRLPAPLSERIANFTSNIFTPQGREVDIAIAGVPFRLATSRELPVSIETIPIRREQLDTETDPGEQSLTSWWRRSQASWHEGAGNLYQENSNQTVDSFTYFDSEGVDVFTKGKLTLLKRMVEWTVTPTTATRIRTYGTAPSVSFIGDGDLYTSPTVGGTATALHNPAGKTVADGLISGINFYDVATDGTLYEGLVSSPGTATTWPLGATASRLAWGKHRLWVIGGRNLWQPDLSLAAATPQPAVFENPNQGWTYTCLAEGPTGMLFGGHDGSASSIQIVTLDSGGGLPTLSGAAVTAVLPDGELVQELATLAGQYVGIGTSRGFRVGRIDGGQLSYGPLIIEPAGVTACTSVTTQGRFFLVGFATGGSAVTYRVDTGTALDGDVFPQAKDVQCDITGSVTSLAAASGSRLVATASDGSVWYQSATEYVDSGFLTTGRIRFRTNEPKAYKSLSLEIEPLAGNIGVALVKEGDTELGLGSITAQGAIYDDRFGIDAETMRHASIKFTLTPTNDKLAAPVIRSYQLRALPAVKPQRMLTLPLLCFDREQSFTGQRYGGEGFAQDRLAALQLLEDNADVLLFQDFTSLNRGGYLVLIESIRYIQTEAAYAQRSNTGGPGGIVIVQLRTVGD